MTPIRFGSRDSVDVDELTVLTSWHNLDQLKKISAASPNNCNLVQIHDGVITECLKGAPDETNNAVYHTYHLHPQTAVCPVERPVLRNVILKVVRATRICLSLLSRTPYRAAIKEALQSLNQMQRQAVLLELRFSGLDLDADTAKSIAFQLGQCFLLVTGTEVYTKSEIAAHLPDLQDLLYRQAGADRAPLDAMRDRLLAELRNVYVRQEEDLNLFCYKNGAEGKKWNRFTCQARGMIIDMKKERCIHFPSEKFFKLNERPETSLEALLLKGEPEIVEKIDGSMVSCYQHEGLVKWACKGNFTVEQSRKAQSLMPESIQAGLEFERYSYVFEVVYPENRYPRGYGIVDYPGVAAIFLIFMRDKRTNQTLSYEQIIAYAQSLGLSHPEVFQGRFADAVQACSQRAYGLQKEGYVARFGDAGFVKIKYEAYKQTLKVCNQLRSHQFLHTYVSLTPAERDRFVEELPDYVQSIARERLAELEARMEAMKHEFSVLSSRVDGDLASFVKQHVAERLQNAFYRFVRGQDCRAILEKHVLQDLDSIVVPAVQTWADE